ncbi:uncharacterized protein ZBIST_3371 [Zygosaccharomyces bailii]|uniref:ZYBA0S06-00760g1_1 n=1 Tax=Zygosaccharomyces bailii (strain CLIB 213 / ATCC 58445 / CBS 680 / BCRC 21525 / NBRC 1098 / NCYC 1416 / NRRL Y-2227) TaxID=1333698 RepID=A0A8J2T724_ZYGB2|nr:ZYBA0S06-00760g1_1 [Zygosaccharomyces bailii CLIB 213]CDH16669.1 uncharacterized protein ZBAI_08457 [Zygosaccharomyces bailii ISA1307]SJM87182.1 uncharacterized protein ZBIST_3371 [Zygosaccharomyces bailii]
MNDGVITDKEVYEFFLAADRSVYLSFLHELENALQRYSKNPSIIPHRIKGTTPSHSTIHMYMPVIDDVYSGVKTLGFNVNSNLGFVGSINVTDADSGALYGTLEAKQVTGIRTALASCIGLYHQLTKYVGVSTINLTVFGAGLQAFWHIMCSIQLFKGHCEALHVRVLHRSNPMDVEPLMKAVSTEEDAMNVTVEQFLLSNAKAVRECVNSSHVIFGCIPSESPNLHYKDLSEFPTSVEHTYVSLIGSYKINMHECDEDMIKQFQNQGSLIIVDSKEHTPLESGELYDAMISPENLLEIGQLAGTKSPTIKCDNGRTLTLCKIVGLSIMDICVSKKLLEISNTL